MGMFFHSAEPAPPRTADPALRRANLPRIGRLFVAYRLRLGALLVLIVGSAALGVVPAFLLKRVLEAIGRNDTTALSLNAGGMIAIAVVTGVLGVLQTLLSNQGGGPAIQPRRPAPHARPPGGRLPSSPAAVARVLHAHPHRRGAVADLQRHRRRA